MASATDAVGGLLVMDLSGRWPDPPVVPGALVCNIWLMRWSNVVYVSTPLKVVNPSKDRYSVAFICLLPALISCSRLKLTYASKTS
jgi:isopenicillin N synthase-like dioxygenase